MQVLKGRVAALGEYGLSELSLPLAAWFSPRRQEQADLRLSTERVSCGSS